MRFMSVDFQNLVQALQNNFALLAEFLEEPKKVISRYNLTDEECKALLSRNVDVLAELCGSQQMAAGVLSGAHTPTCRPGTGPGPF